MGRDYLFFHTEQLPESLTQKETEKYFSDYKNGNQNARDILIIHNIRLVAYIVGKMRATTEKKDLVSLGIIGLIKAVDTFDLTKEYHFSSYAKRCIVNEIITYFKKNSRHQNNISFEGTYEDMEFNSVENIENEYIEKEMIKNLREMITFLSEKEQKIICMYFGINQERRYRQVEIAKELNMNQGNLSREIIRIIEKLKKMYIMRYLLDNYSDSKNKILRKGEK